VLGASALPYVKPAPEGDLGIRIARCGIKLQGALFLLPPEDGTSHIISSSGQLFSWHFLILLRENGGMVHGWVQHCNSPHTAVDAYCRHLVYACPPGPSPTRSAMTCSACSSSPRLTRFLRYINGHGPIHTSVDQQPAAPNR